MRLVRNGEEKEPQHQQKTKKEKKMGQSPLPLTAPMPGNGLTSTEVIYLLPKVSKLINILKQRPLLGV